MEARLGGVTGAAGGKESNPQHPYLRAYAESRKEVEGLRQAGYHEEELDDLASVRLSLLLEQEAKRQGLVHESQLDDTNTSPEFQARYAGLTDALAGRKAAPPAYQRPFSALAKAYLEDRQRPGSSNRLTPQTIGQMEPVYRLFRDHMDDAPVATVSRRTAKEFFDKAKRLDAHWGCSPQTKNRTFQELLTISEAKDGNRLTDRTLFRYMVALGQLWEWAKDGEEVQGDNPFPRQIKKGDGQARVDEDADDIETNAPWTDDAILAYFDTHPDQSKEGRPDPFFWLPRVALLSGMRLDEICSLEASDIKTAEGVRYFDITGGKTTAAERVIPIHRDLAGFLKVALKTGFLFPELIPGGPDEKRSWNISKRLGRRFKQVPGTSTFHGLRHNAATAFDRSGARETDTAQILGHGRKGITYGVYSKGMTIQQKYKLVHRLSLPSPKRPD